MKILNPDLLAIGLDSGVLFGWTLSTNSFDKVEAHQASPIMSIKTHGTFLLTGDRKGNIQIRNMANNFQLATREIQSVSKGGTKDSKSINSITVVDLKGEFIVYAGNNDGIISVTKVIDEQNYETADFSAFREQQ